MKKKKAEELFVKKSIKQECTTCKESDNIKQDLKKLHENYTKLKTFAMNLSEENTELKQMTSKGKQMSW